MIIHVLCNDGSPLGITMKDLWGNGCRGIGVGGSEYALLTMCEYWHNAGHNVVLFNNPFEPNGSPFEQRAIHQYNPAEKRDVLITFRSPNYRTAQTTNCLKVWWSCDQYTVGNYKEFAKYIDKIVCISNFHAGYFIANYGIMNAEVIDIPIRIQDLDAAGDVSKIHKKVIFTSVPERGLHYLRSVWPQIQTNCPGVSLTITSDYRLWGVEERNQHHRQAWRDIQNVRFLGAIPRKQLIVEQLEAQILAYPNIYDELFCVSVAEAQCAGVYPITSGVGALSSTNMGKVIGGDPKMSGQFRVDFVDAIVKTLNGDQEELKKKQEEIKKMAIARFSPHIVGNQWDKKIFSGG